MLSRMLCGFYLDLNDPEFASLTAFGWFSYSRFSTPITGDHYAAGYDGNGIIVYMELMNFSLMTAPVPHDYVSEQAEHKGKY